MSSSTATTTEDSFQQHVRVLTDEQIQQFRDRGVVVVSLLSKEDVQRARTGLAKTLLRHHVNVDNLPETAIHLKALSSTNGAGGILDLFYEDWKFALNEHEAVLKAMQDLWAATYASNTTESFLHPFGPFDPSKGYMYIDRLCYRIPDEITSNSKKKSLQRSLTPHLDCCPTNRFSGQKWRPIQCFVSLTDTTEPECGGLEVCPGHHIGFDEWAQTRLWSTAKDGSTSPPPCVGQFTPIRPKEDQDILEKFEHIPMQAGDVVFWDYRIPHANAQHNFASYAREVAYLGFLPDVDINRSYALDQLDRFQQGILPADQWHKSTLSHKMEYDFSAVGKKLMAMEPW